MPHFRARLTSLLRTPIRPELYRVITMAALVALATIVVTGGAVRLTGSGMGCTTWPNCESGSLVPRGSTGEHGWIEFLNRLFTGVLSVAVILAVLGARRRAPRRADLVRWSWGLVAGVGAQAVLGGIVVLLHVAPLAVAGHYLLSAVLVWNAVVLHHKASEPAGVLHPRATPQLLRWSRSLVALGGVVLVAGTVVTGSGPHGGDEAADRLPFAITTVARLHSAAVWTFLAVALVVLHRLRRGDASADVLGRGNLLVGLVVAQGTLGYIQYATGVPELLVAGHLLGSVLVWIAVLRLHLALTAPLPARAGAPSRAAPAPAAPAVP